MNREIKFRVWDKQEKRMMEWNELVQKNYDIGFIFNHSHRFIPLQFTGLLDKNGKEIYEGDIIKSGDHIAGKIFWCQERAQWMVEWFEKEERLRIPDELCDYKQHLIPEIIGNVFENPELINQDE